MSEKKNLSFQMINASDVKQITPTGIVVKRKYGLRARPVLDFLPTSYEIKDLHGNVVEKGVLTSNDLEKAHEQWKLNLSN